ncbi:hypothetical protein D3C79_1111420 [compost metagenome]
MRQQLVIGATETDVLLVAQQQRLWAHLGHAFYRIIDRGVVDHEVTGELFAIGLTQRIEHGL